MKLKKNCKQPNFKKRRLIPVIIQTCRGEVVMLGFTNKKAYDFTLKTELAWFWSRSRKELWLKGGTSGNFLKVIEILLDCDHDTLIYTVIVTGPVCHTGQNNCFSKITG